MRFFHVSCGNGYCGCDEEWVMACETEPTLNEVVECYSYLDGVSGLEIGEDEDEDCDITEEEYYLNIYENVCVEEITLQEFNDFIEDGLEKR